MGLGGFAILTGEESLVLDLAYLFGMRLGQLIAHGGPGKTSAQKVKSCSARALLQHGCGKGKVSVTRRSPFLPARQSLASTQTHACR